MKQAHGRLLLSALVALPLLALQLAARGSGEADRAGGALAAVGPAAPATSAYRLELSLDEGMRLLTGSLSLRWTNGTDSPLSRLQLMLFANLTPGRMEVLRCSVAGAPAATVSRVQGALLDIRLPRALPAGAAAEVVLDYRVTLPDDAQGQYAGLTSTGGLACLAYCYPVALDPGSWDGEAPVAWADFLVKEASTYRVTLEVPAGAQVMAPGELRRSRTTSGRLLVESELAPARDFFAAVARGRAEARVRAGSIEIRALAPQNDGASAMAIIAREAIAVYQRRFGPYPYRSFVTVAAPFAALGLELPGAALISDRLLDPDGSTGNVPNRVMLEATLVHEVAHQWFYNLVGSDQVREPWLDEALAQYAMRLYYLDRGGEAAADEIATSFNERWGRVGRAPIPIGLPAARYTAKEYGAVVYGRGPLFLQALADRMGRPAFDRLLRQWVDRNRWRIAAGGDFLALATEVCGCHTEDLFEEWVWP